MQPGPSSATNSPSVNDHDALQIYVVIYLGIDGTFDSYNDDDEGDILVCWYICHMKNVKILNLTKG